MNLQDFDTLFKDLKSQDKVQVDLLCDHEQHIKDNKTIGKAAARKNIQKSGGEKFICRDCMMKHNNPMNQTEPSRQTKEIVDVICPHPDHIGDKTRQMELRCYYGKMEKPYTQHCGRCVQLGKEITQEQKDKISESLSGRNLTDDHRNNIAKWWAEHPEDVRKYNLKRGKHNPKEE